MICPSCGHQNDEDAKFCNMCGVRMAVPPSPPSYVPEQPLHRRQASLTARESIQPLIQPMGQAKPPPKAVKPFYKKWWVWVAAVALLLSVFVIFLSLRSNRYDLMERPQSAQQEAGTTGSEE